MVGVPDQQVREHAPAPQLTVIPLQSVSGEHFISHDPFPQLISKLEQASIPSVQKTAQPYSGGQSIWAFSHAKLPLQRTLQAMSAGQIMCESLHTASSMQAILHSPIKQPPVHSFGHVSFNGLGSGGHTGSLPVSMTSPVPLASWPTSIVIVGEEVSVGDSVPFVGAVEEYSVVECLSLGGRPHALSKNNGRR